MCNQDYIIHEEKMKHLYVTSALVALVAESSRYSRDAEWV